MGAPRPGSVTALLPVGSKLAPLAELPGAIARAFEDESRLSEILFLVHRSNLMLEELHGLEAHGPARIRVLEFEPAVGEASMLRAGAEAASGSLILTLPSPPEVEFSAISGLLGRVDEGVDLVVAARVGSSAGRSAIAQSRLFNRVISIAAGMRVQDVASGTRLLRAEVLDQIPLYGDFHRYLPILAERAGFRREEIAAEQHAGSQRAAVHSPKTYLWRLIDVLAVLFISRFTRRPLRLFGSFGAGFAVVGLAILAVVGVERILGTPLGNRPILVLGTLLVGLGVHSFTIGLLGELLLFFTAGSFRDYRVARVWEPGAPLHPTSRSSDQTRPTSAEAPPRARRQASAPRTSDTRPPR